MDILVLYKEAFAIIAEKYKAYCIDANHELNASSRPRFPIDKPSQAKKALKRVHELTDPPSWWEGSIDELKRVVEDKVKSHYIVEQKGDKFIVKQKS